MPERRGDPRVRGRMGAPTQDLAQSGAETGNHGHRQRSHDPIQTEVSHLRETHPRYRTGLGEWVYCGHIANDSNTTMRTSVSNMHLREASPFCTLHALIAKPRALHGWDGCKETERQCAGRIGKAGARLDGRSAPGLGPTE